MVSAKRQGSRWARIVTPSRKEEEEQGGALLHMNLEALCGQSGAGTQHRASAEHTGALPEMTRAIRRGGSRPWLAMQEQSCIGLAFDSLSAGSLAASTK